MLRDAYSEANPVPVKFFLGSAGMPADLDAPVSKRPHWRSAPDPVGHGQETQARQEGRNVCCLEPVALVVRLGRAQ